jgi:hypothetical protein
MGLWFTCRACSKSWRRMRRRACRIGKIDLSCQTERTWYLIFINKLMGCRRQRRAASHLARQRRVSARHTVAKLREMASELAICSAISTHSVTSMIIFIFIIFKRRHRKSFVFLFEKIVVIWTTRHSMTSLIP